MEAKPLKNSSEDHKVLIVGKPNTGKSLLFTRLTGIHQKVANFPGVTVEVKSGRRDGFEFFDFPGLYSLNAMTEDEKVSVREFENALRIPEVKTVLCVLDATRLERSLVLGLQVRRKAIESGKFVIFALNLIDELHVQKLKVDVEGLSQELGSKVIPISAKKQTGLSELKTAIVNTVQNDEPQFSREMLDNSDAVAARKLAKKFGPNTDVILAGQRKADQFFLHSVFGGLSFVAIMVFLFQAIFTWAAPLMDGIESAITWLSGLIVPLLPAGVAADFVEQAIFGGIGSFLVFVPQIFVLMLIIGFLEDSGYLARAAIICHKPLSLFGLSGRSFIPLLSGHACAIPAIMATRSMESPRRRLLTILAVPLMSCSARLPVYAVLISALIPQVLFFGGVIGLQGLVFFGVYALGIVAALSVTGLLSRTAFKSTSDAPFVVELPPYRMPHWRPLLRRALNSSWMFVYKAGAIIFVVTVVVWFLAYFPNGPENLESSFLGSLGKWIEPIFEPLGLTWPYAVAILASFLAREVFVGTLGTLFGIEGADENISGLAEHIQNSGFSVASGIALLVFYAIALQCVSTLAVMKKETASWRIPAVTFISYSFLAYALSWVAYEIVRAFL